MIKPIRTIVLMSSAVLTAAAILGCHKDYQERINQRLESLKYKQRLDANLAAPLENPLQQHEIYLRPPNTLSAAGNILNIPQGLFDVNLSFVDNSQESIEAADRLHIFVRHKLPAASSKKKNAAPAPALNSRKDMIEDVLSLFLGIQGAKVERRDIDKRLNKFKQQIYSQTQLGRTVELYSYATPKKEYEVVFVVERPDKTAITEKINLMLESFAVGEVARRKFNSGGEEDEGGEINEREAVF